MSVAGCGAVFERHHLPALQKSRDWQLIAVCDPVPERRVWVRRSVGGYLPIFESLSDLLAGLPADAMLIAAPPDTHCVLAIQALRAGLHVLVEKPMALSTTDARAMLEASRHVGRHLWVGFSRRFLPAYIDLRTRLARIPREHIRGVRFVFSTDVRSWRAVSTYRGDDSRGGGVVDDIVSHQLDLLPWLLGVEIQEISSESANVDGGGQRVRCSVRFTDGLVAHCDARHADRYLETVEIQLADRTLVAHWRQGVDETWHESGLLKSLARLAGVARSARQAVRRSSPMAYSFAKQLEAFAAVVRGHKPLLMGADAVSGLRNVLAIHACRQSLERGGRWTRALEDAAPPA